MNGNNVPFVAYSWKAGGPKFGGQDAGEFWKDGIEYATASAAGLDGGDITPTGASVGTKQGFSIITYTGNGSDNQTIQTGLTETLNFMIVKSRTSSGGWHTRHTSMATGYTNLLNSTGEYYNNWDGRPAEQSTPGLLLLENGDNNNHNINTDTHLYVAYCWHNVPGLQKFGSFEGNEDADGPFVELGFRPAVVIWKCIDASSAWTIEDGERSKYNVVDARLFLNDGTVGGNEVSNGNGNCDFLSNGFKIRTSHAGINVASTIIYAAWAEAPTFNLYGAQSNAR